MKNLVKTFFLLLCCTYFGNTQAGMVTLTGNSVSYTYDDSLLGLYGTPTLTGADELFFTPVSFIATTDSGSDRVRDMLNIKVEALPGYTINLVNLLQEGFYETTGDGEVGVQGRLRVTDMASTLNRESESFSVNPDSGEGEWSNTESIDFSSFAASFINISLRNRLFADADDDDGMGYIDIDGISLGVTTTLAEVPLPASVWLFGSTLLGLFAYSKRTTNRARAYNF